MIQAQLNSAALLSYYLFSRMTKLFNLLWIERTPTRYWEITVMSMWLNGLETIIFLIISDILILISNCMTKYNCQSFMTFDSVDKRWNKLWHPNVIHSPLNTLITKNTNKYLLGWERHGSPCPGGCLRVLW